MDSEIKYYKLYEFISVADRDNIEFARYTYYCSARKFVIETVDHHPITEAQIRSYEFADFYLAPNQFSTYNYHVLAILGKSYLMYEISDEIFIWVCYTEEGYREKGHASNLLSRLKETNPEKIIKTDTYNKSLEKICMRLGIQL